MKKSIKVCNEKRVQKALKTKVEINEDLCNRKDCKVKEFLKQYEKELSSFQREDMQDFFRKTGLFLTFYCISSDSQSEIFSVIVTQNGALVQRRAEAGFPKVVYQGHLLIVLEADELEVEGNTLVLEGKRIPLPENIWEEKQREKEFFENLKLDKESVPSRRALEENGYFLPEENEKISYVSMDAFGMLVSLTKEGKVYLGDVLYAEGVRSILEFNTTDMYFIYQNKNIENYTSSQMSCGRIKKYEKIFYGYNYLVTLKEKIVELYFFPILSSCPMIEGETFRMYFEEVDDISIEKTEDTDILVLKKKQESISVPILGIWKES